VHERTAARIHAIVNCTVQKCAERRDRACTCRWPRTLHTCLPAFPALHPPLRNMQMRFIARPLLAALQPAAVKRTDAIVELPREFSAATERARTPRIGVRGSRGLRRFAPSAIREMRRDAAAKSTERVLATVSRYNWIGRLLCVINNSRGACGRRRIVISVSN